jgi:hypothetical protein
VLAGSIVIGLALGFLMTKL